MILRKGKSVVTTLLAAALLASSCAPAAAYGASSLPPAATAAVTDCDEYSEFDAWFAKWQKDNPEEVKRILNEMPELYIMYGYDSKKEMLSDYGLTEADYADWAEDEKQEYLADQAWDIWYYEGRKDEIKAERIAMGGPAEGVGIMLNDKYITFTDVQPEISGGRTMAPLRAVLETLGAEVEYTAESKLVSADLNGRHIELTVGGNTLTITENGDTRTVQMDCAAYIKGGRTMIPVRFVSEAGGYDVLWDSEYSTAVILDREGIIADIDKEYTIVNKALKSFAESYDPEKTYSVGMNVNAALTMLDSISGNKTANGSGTLNGLFKGENASMTFALELGQIIKLVMNENEYMDDIYGTLADTLSNLNGQIIVNADAGKTYVKSPALAKLYPGQLTADTWLEYDESFGDMYGYYLMGSSYDYTDLTENLTVGNLAYIDNSYFGGVYSYEYVEEAVNATPVAWLKDERFTRSGNTNTLHINLDNALSYCKDIASEDETADEVFEYMFGDMKEFDLTLNVTNNGSTTALSGGLTYFNDSNSWYYSNPRIQMSFNLNPESAKVDLEIHKKNTMKLNMGLNMTMRKTGDTVPAAPPSGAKIVNADDLEEPDAYFE